MKITIMATALLFAAMSAYGQKPKPTLKETLSWIQDALNSDYGDTEKQTAKGTEIYALRLADFSGCQVHFVLTEAVAGTETFHEEYSFDLRDIDPVKGGFASPGITSNDSGLFTAATQNEIEKIATKTSYGPGSLPAYKSKSALFVVDFYSPYGDDFAKEFTRAVKMCGGKPSIFPESNRGDSDGRASLAPGVVAAQSAKPAAHQRPDVTRSTETRLADAYYVRAYEHGTYIIDHKGRRLTAKCRNSLSWPNGLGTFGTPVNEHDCVYMHDLLGKTIGEDLMKQWNETLVYSPWKGENTVQTADYLDIADDEPLTKGGTKQGLAATPAAPAPASIPPRKDIPAIAKAANGAIVSIVMSDKDGKPIAQGSGFLVSKDGLVVTNYHVISEGSSAVVKLPEGAFYVVEGVVASDKVRDLAVIKTHGKSFRTLSLGNSDQLQVGEEVVAIGNPLSLESTVSNGIVSGIRTAEELGGKFLQVTTPISPGSSGGPLFNMAGEVVGITTLYLQGGENLNFAIPINDAKRLLLAKSSTLHALPNEPEPVKAQKHDATPSASTTASMPDLKTTVEFMGRMVEPEHRLVLPGELKGAVLHPHIGRSMSIVSDRHMFMVYATGETEKNGYLEFTYSIVSDGDGKHEQKDYPRYMSFALGDIDPSSIESKEGGYDPYALSEFWDKHPKCGANPQCVHEYTIFLHSAPKLTIVHFHTTDLKPLVERGGCSENGSCELTGTMGDVLIFFKSKDRADRFVTALTYAVKLEGGKPDLFPPK